jgi:bacterioferritin
VADDARDRALAGLDRPYCGTTAAAVDPVAQQVCFEPKSENSVNVKESGNGTELSSIATLRARARKHIEAGAVTEGYAADRDTVLRLLNEALATEIVCTLRYRRHYFMADGVQAEAVKQEFLTHAQEEQAHADLIAARIVQLDGEPNFDPRGLTERSHAEYVAGDSLDDMIREDLVAERVAIDSYKEMISYIGPRDPTTKRMLEEILAKEEEHAEDLSSMLSATKPRGRADQPAR